MRSEIHRAFEHLFTILGLDHFVAAALEDSSQQFPAAQRIVSDENPCR